MGCFFSHAAYQVHARVARESRREFIASRSNAALRGVGPLVSSAPWPGGRARKDWLLSQKSLYLKVFGRSVSDVAQRCTKPIWTPTSAYVRAVNTTSGCRPRVGSS